MSGLRNMHNAWVGAACCLAVIGCGERSSTPTANTDSANPPVSAAQSGNDPAAGSAAPAAVQSSGEPSWYITEETDEMTGTVAHAALYRAIVDSTTIEVEMTCPEQGADGGLLQVTTHDGLLATAFDNVLARPSASARLDTGDGNIRSIALMNSDKYQNVYFYVNRGNVQMSNALAMEIPILRDAPIGASWLALNGDPTNFKLELELDNGMKRVVRGDATLARYLDPCTSQAMERRQQQKAEEQRQLQEAEKQKQQEGLDQWLNEQGEAPETASPTTEPEDGEVSNQ